MRAWWIVALSWLWMAFPAQTQEGAHRSRMTIERSTDVCSALRPDECCAQMLEIALFRATGDQLPKSAKVPVRLSCKDPERTMPDNACRLIAMGRGLDARAVAELCAPEKLAKRCSDDATCKQCMSDLERLEWKAPARACYALTYVAASDNAGVARVRRAGLR
jgi:hypothetical protein